MKCEPCTTSGRDNGPAEFVWYCPNNGYWCLLCASCVGWWLLYAMDDGNTFRVSQLEPA